MTSGRGATQVMTVCEFLYQPDSNISRLATLQKKKSIAIEHGHLVR
jgi:hypothetical protein